MGRPPTTTTTGNGGAAPQKPPISAPPNFAAYPNPAYENPTPLAPPVFEVYGTPVLGKPWSTGLFDCHENETNAVMTAFLPCVTFGQIAEILDEGQMTCPMGSSLYLIMMPALCSHWIIGSKYRTMLRNRYGLVEAPYEDTISHVFCPCCSLCQEFRELQRRDLDPALGWNGILAQRQGIQYRQQVHVPPMAQGMNR